jgi:hypothetical protein
MGLATPRAFSYLRRLGQLRHAVIYGRRCNRYAIAGIKGG